MSANDSLRVGDHDVALAWIEMTYACDQDNCDHGIDCPCDAEALALVAEVRRLRAVEAAAREVRDYGYCVAYDPGQMEPCRHCFAQRELDSLLLAAAPPETGETDNA